MQRLVSPVLRREGGNHRPFESSGIYQIVLVEAGIETLAVLIEGKEVGRFRILAVELHKEIGIHAGEMANAAVGSIVARVEAIGEAELPAYLELLYFVVHAFRIPLLFVNRLTPLYRRLDGVGIRQGEEALIREGNSPLC